MAQLMKCGHSAQAVDQDGKPVCVACVGINPGATQVADEPNLTNRTAVCDECGRHEVPSSTNLAFFSWHPTWDKDRYYCGCHGWE